MNKSYIIVPVILLALFGFLYNGALKEMTAKETALAEAKAKIAADDAKRKAEVEARAQADADKRSAERAAADKAKEEKKQRDYDDAMRKLKDEASDYSTQSDKFAKEAADLEIQISQSRNDREKLNRETLDLSKQVELAKISRRNAELEIQRMIDMVGKKLSDSSLAALPPPPPPLPTK